MDVPRLVWILGEIGISSFMMFFMYFIIVCDSDKSDPLSTHQDQSVQDSLDQSACSPILVSRRKRPVFIDSETEDSDSSATRLHTVSDKIGHLDRSPYSPVLEAPHKHPVFTVSEKEASKPIAATSTFLETVLNSWSLQGCLNQSLYSPTVGETEDPDLSAARMQAIDKGEICNLVSGQGSPDGHGWYQTLVFICQDHQLQIVSYLIQTGLIQCHHAVQSLLPIENGLFSLTMIQKIQTIHLPGCNQLNMKKWRERCSFVKDPSVYLKMMKMIKIQSTMSQAVEI